MASAGIDPAISAPIALAGRVVTMDRRHSVVDDAVVYCHDGNVVEVRARKEPPPSGFETVAVVDTGATIYPGLIELHNHLAYDALPLWRVPQLYANRGQWGNPNPPYRQQISGPMQLLGRDDDATAAVARFSEVKCLLGGTTTSQGIRLFSSARIVRFFHGLVRNVEQTGDPELPNAAARIPDVIASQASRFMRSISGRQKKILHLAEGIDDSARNHFLSLKLKKRWAITENLIGVHCTALHADDFAVFGGHGGSMVWSPFSNLLLYGQTADVSAARRHKVPIALGSDWSPSGSKNLLGELKVARLAAPPGVDDRDLVDMATRTPAEMLGWDQALGSLSPGCRADLLAVAGTTGDPYTKLVDALETDVVLVTINGVPRSGTPALMQALGCDGERIHLGRQQRALNLAQATVDPEVAALSVAEATDLLEALFRQMPPPRGAIRRARRRRGARLVVEGVIDTPTANGPRLRFEGHRTGPTRLRAAAIQVPAGEAAPVTLGGLCAATDPAFVDAIRAEPNLPPTIRDGLVAAFTA
jgi:5-methylthioadenosine/S-adenosylhomocysteine deaminase